MTGYFRLNRKSKSPTSRDRLYRAFREEARRLGRDHRPLSEFRVVGGGGQVYDFLAAVRAHPMLMDGIGFLRRDRRERGIARCHEVHGVELPGVGSGEFDHFPERTAQAIGVALRDGYYRPGSSHTYAIPKPICDGSIAEGDLVEAWATRDRRSAMGADAPRCGESEKNGKTRTLTIMEPIDTAVARALTVLLSDYAEGVLKWRVVGSRPGMGPSDAWGRLDEVIRTRGRSVLVSVDLASYYDTIPIERALQELDKVTKYREVPGLDAHIRMLMQSETGKVPQGNPISPLLANVYGQASFDRVARKHGPMLRYVDDGMILVESIEKAAEAVDDLRKRLKGWGLRISDPKTRIFDLVGGRSYDADGKATTTRERPVWLGGEIRLAGETTNDGIAVNLTDEAVRSLFERVIQAWFGVDHTKGNDLTILARRLRAVVPILQGWIQHYRRLHRSKRQERGIQTILALARCDWEILEGELQRIGLGRSGSMNQTILHEVTMGIVGNYVNKETISTKTIKELIKRIRSVKGKEERRRRYLSPYASIPKNRSIRRLIDPKIIDPNSFLENFVPPDHDDTKKKVSETDTKISKAKRNDEKERNEQVHPKERTNETKKRIKRSNRNKSGRRVSGKLRIRWNSRERRQAYSSRHVVTRGARERLPADFDDDIGANPSGDDVPDRVDHVQPQVAGHDSPARAPP